MSIIIVFLTLLSISLTQTCEIFVGMSCSCYESIDMRCTIPKVTPLIFVSPSINRTFQSIDLKFNSEEYIHLDSDYFIILNRLLSNTTQYTLSITIRFQNFYSFHSKKATFRNLFQNVHAPYTRLIIELHPLRAKSIIFDQNSFENLQVNELSIYADSLTTPFELIFNNTNLTHLNIEGATVAHDSSLLSTFKGQIRSLKVTRMIDIVNSDEFPSFPAQTYTIEAHKIRKLDALSFLNYTQLTGLNIIQPDVSITPRILNGLEKLSSLRSVSLDAERIADGALKHVKHIQTLTLGSFLKILDIESLNSLESLQQLDLRYVQFSTLQANTSCNLADYINRGRISGLIVYLPNENLDCDCVLTYLNNLIDNGEQLSRCQSINNDRCLFSSCSIVSDYFTGKQKEIQPMQIRTSTIAVPTIVPPVIDFDDQDLPFYPDSKEQTTTIKVFFEPNIYDDEELFIAKSTTTTTIATTTTTTTTTVVTTISSTSTMTTTTTTTIATTSSITTTVDEIDNEPSSLSMESFNPKLKTYASTNYITLSWIPFAIIASCLFFSLIIAMISYVIYHKRRTVSFKLVPQTLPII